MGTIALANPCMDYGMRWRIVLHYNMLGATLHWAEPRDGGPCSAPEYKKPAVSAPPRHPRGDPSEDGTSPTQRLPHTHQGHYARPESVNLVGYPERPSMNSRSGS